MDEKAKIIQTCNTHLIGPTKSSKEKNSVSDITSRRSDHDLVEKSETKPQQHPEEVQHPDSLESKESKEQSGDKWTKDLGK